MKRILCSVSALALIFALFAACGGGNNAPSSTQPPAAAPTQTVAPATPPPPPPEAEGWDFSNATKVNLQFAMFIPEADPMTGFTCKYLDTIKEYTEGTVDYTLFAGQTLCAAPEQLDAVRSGLADVSFCNAANHAGELPLTNILEYPGIPYANNIASSYAIQEWHDTLKLDELKDFRLLFASGQGNGSFVTTVPLRTVDDFKGVQMRTSAALVPILEAYGMIPTAMAIGEAYEAIRTGVVQGATCQVPAGYSFRFHEVGKYCTLDPYFISSYVMIMNKDVWDTLTPDQQEAVQAATEVAFIEYIAPARQAEVPGVLVEFEAAGVEIFIFDDENTAKMGELNAPLQSKYASGVRGGNEALALIRELAAKWNAIYPEQ